MKYIFILRCVDIHGYNTYGNNGNKWKEMMSKKFKTVREQNKEHLMDFKEKFNFGSMSVVTEKWKSS